MSSFHFEVLDWSIEAINWVIRLVIAASCGFTIGFERKSRSKEAGIRTHTIVCFASALIMIVSKYCAADMLEPLAVGIKGADPSRIAAQIVSGIGFLGAGIIFYKRNLLHGLTTAAGVWATAGIGMAIGCGMIVTGIVATLILVLLQVLLHRPWRIIFNQDSSYLHVQLTVTEADVLDKVQDIFHINRVVDFKTSTGIDGTNTADMEITTDVEFTPKQLYELMLKYNFIRSVEKMDEQ